MLMKGIPMQKIVPFLWFNEEGEEAAAFYTSIFKNSRAGANVPLGDNVPGPKGKVMIVEFSLNGQEFVALNGGPEFRFTPAISFFVTFLSQAELDAAWQQLVDGGSVLMPLQEYPFSQRFGWLNDRYGVSWQLILGAEDQTIRPCLMFVQDKHGRAEEAIHFYTHIFPNTHSLSLERYAKDEGGEEGKLKHARFDLQGMEFIAMDGGVGHAFSFTPAISLFVHCADQAEIDSLWQQLPAGGGAYSQCGWLEDRFGVSWQIVPTALLEMQADPDPARVRRVNDAMLKMQKLDIAALQQAYNQ
jgi:predicted 3-demethylubiquinone-9 3-methyltransferase (glyoxalase superfamily)